MLVPYYWNKKSAEKTYEKNDYTWIDLSKFLVVLDEKVLKDFEDLNWFNLWNEMYKEEFKQKCAKYSPVNINWDNFVNFEEFIISAKLLLMTWFTNKYWYWWKSWLNKLSTWKIYTHHGIDLILPKWTPIVSFSDGHVESAQYANGYWNYVVIKSVIDSEILYFGYEHLDTIKVSDWENVKKWDIIWTCWNSWNSSWYHLHFQIDKNTWTFHPYWSSWEDDVEKTLQNCIDPWVFLIKNYMNKNEIKNEIKNENKNEDKNKNTSVYENNIKKSNQEEKSDDWDDFDIVWELVKEIEKKEKNNVEFVSSNKDLSNQKVLNKQIENNKNFKNNEDIELVSTENNEDFIDHIQQKLKDDVSDTDYIKFFVNAGILKWDKWNYMLDEFLTRYQITIILYRLYKSWLLKIKENKAPCNTNFKDITSNLKSDQEFLDACEFVFCNNILSWQDNNFLPWNKLTWEQFLAIVWRLFAWLKNSTWKIWYETYYNWAVDKNIIEKNWLFVDNFITRNEVFKVFHKLILS